MNSGHKKALDMLHDELLHIRKTGKNYFELDREFQIQNEIEALLGDNHKLSFYLNALQHNAMVYLNEKINALIRDLQEEKENLQNKVRKQDKYIRGLSNRIVYLENMIDSIKNKKE